MQLLHYTRHRFIRFLLVGVLNAAAGYGVFALILYIGLHYSLATLLATVFGICFNYVTTGKLVFKTTGQSHLPRFILIYGLLYLINIGLIKILCLIGTTPYIAGLIALPFMAVITYFLQSRLVFISRPVSP